MPAPVFIGAAPPQPTMSSSYSRREYGFGSTPGSLRDMIIDSMFDHPTPTSFNSHFAPSSIKSDTADRMPSFESAFCQGYMCCGIQLDDLHHLLEHFEETHVNDLPSDAPKSPQAAIQDLKKRAKNIVLQAQATPPATTSAAVIAAALATAAQPNASSYSSSPAAVPTPHPTPVVTAASLPPLDNRPRSPGLSSVSSNCPSPVTPAGGSFDMDDVEMDTDDASDDNSQALFPTAGRNRTKKRSYASALALGRLRGTLDNLNIAAAEGPRTPGSAGSSRTGSAVASPTMGNLDSDDEGMDTDDGDTSSVSSLAASGGLPPSAFYPNVQNTSPSPPSVEEPAHKLRSDGIPVLNVPGLPENFVPPMPTLPSGRTWVPPANKPFKCPVPGCDKAYKQQNGLKYHRLHGHCNNRAGGAVGKEAEGRETLEEKPHGCYVGAACGKRYKNMNGLRYHYMHSGEHGQIGLAMLAAGTHPSPLLPTSAQRQAGSNHSSRSASPAVAAKPVILPLPLTSS